ncbi:hypothetical protein AAY81_04060 [Denitrobacterium detoxificans]|uniref:Uncharacterized protein n=1 Tax=Denitrobacterium detoxificans TaxID=79604 RepID=A0A172RXG3_9ACTN|nr:hypothetical protein [Denitrobacterium detoxificans]ANE22431.1 hypothetical protein AAY81_04060 [Denitrobacterium detoxificans]SEO81532.1 hypothetical protein SAMN02910314_01298 [Denitrobacterium detoxificans]SEP01548.1 hypothetical protein SAMN02910314_01922 [Denitrobacterium detoxificans]
MPKKKRITAEKVRQVKEFVREHPSDRNGQVAAWLDLSETTVRLIRNGAYDHLLDERQQQMEIGEATAWGQVLAELADIKAMLAAMQPKGAM